MTKLPEPFYDHAGITIFHADCQDILPLLPKVDMMLTDPPYGFQRFETDGRNYLELVGPALKLAWELLVDGGSLFCFSGTAGVVNLANSCGLPLKRLLWMYKPNDCTYPLKGWLLTSEAILWFLKDGPCNLMDVKPYRHDTHIVTSVGNEGVNGHPTVKPYSVVRSIAARCPKMGVILDLFMGSGTTLRAAKDLGLKVIGIEIEESYCQIAAKGLEQEIFSFK
jgi:site-specific DNA-methyltransferase (adenine-specific)